MGYKAAEYIEYDSYWREPAKRCTHCKIMKGFSQYGSAKGKRFDLQATCRRCTNTLSKEQWIKHREKRLPLMKAKKAANRAACRRYARTWYMRNIERCREVRRAYDKARRKAGNHPHKRYSRSLRGRFCIIRRCMMAQYGFFPTLDSLYRYFNVPKYRRMHNKWRYRGHTKALAPTVMLKTPELRAKGYTENLEDFVLVTVGDKRSIEARERGLQHGWKRTSDGSFARVGKSKVLSQGGGIDP